VGGIFSEGAGFSAIYPRPTYQNPVAKITGSSMRSVPDITMDAQDGTSESTPMVAGVLALATQLNGGQNVGPINPVLYHVLGQQGAAAGISDVVSGDNSVIDPSTGDVLVQGFSAAPGFDVASGWGTIDASTFVPALVAATQQNDLTSSARQQAAGELRRLQSDVQVTPQSGRTFSVSSGGYLPGHPVTLAVDGTDVATLTTARDGTVSYFLDADALGLARGSHLVTLTSMLITKTGGFGG
jgi:subtilase family serine protease